MLLRENHLLPFFVFVVREFRTAKWALVGTVALLLLEYASLSLMMPLAMSAGDAAASTSARTAWVVDGWTSIANALGLAPSLKTWLWLFLILMTVRTAAGYGHQLITTYLSKQVHRALSANVFKRVLSDEPMTEIYKRSVGFYSSLAGDDTFRAGSLVNYVLLILGAGVSAVAGLGLLFFFSRAIFVATLVFLACSAIVIAFSSKGLFRVNSESVVRSRELNTAFIEALNSLRSIRSMNAERFVRQNYDQLMARYTRLLFLVEAFKGGIRVVPGLVALLTGILLLAPWSNDSEVLSAGTAFGALTILLRIFASLAALMNSGGAFLVDARAAHDLGELTRLTGADGLALDGHGHGRQGAKFDAGQIRVQEVDYSYDGRTKVLDRTSFSMERGRCYAIIGPSGSGKSTLADILLGLIEPQGGAVWIGDQAVSPEELRKCVVLVEQQPRIFSVSLRENLTLGLEVSDAELTAVLEAVDMLAYANSLPDGVETIFQYQGANLSGGQRQRLSIARALLRRPEILVLDEATSALDSATRDMVVARLRPLMKHGVILFITHDAAIAQLADGVLELEGRFASEPAEARVGAAAQAALVP